jgi:hypothetical protein
VSRSVTVLLFATARSAVGRFRRARPVGECSGWSAIVGVAAGHLAEASDAARFLIEELTT